MVHYTTEGRRGTVLDADSRGQRLLLRREEVREGEWEKVVVSVGEVERWEGNGHGRAA